MLTLVLLICVTECRGVLTKVSNATSSKSDRYSSHVGSDGLAWSQTGDVLALKKHTDKLLIIYLFAL